jgi:hypothetical protein
MGTLTKAARGKKFSLDPFFELFRNHYSSKLLQRAVDGRRECRPASGKERK